MRAAAAKGLAGTAPDEWGEEEREEGLGVWDRDAVGCDRVISERSPTEEANHNERPMLLLQAQCARKYYCTELGMTI